MATLQELYDFYLETNPSTGKIRNATNFLIHACQAMDVSSPEDIKDEMLEEIPAAIDRYFGENKQKAVHDKSVLAEMIGRYGPRDGWESVYHQLLKDRDENLRQFTLQAIEYSAQKDFGLVLPYIMQFKNGRNKLMRRVAALLISRLICSEKKKAVTPYIRIWAKEDPQFLRVIIELLEHQAKNSFSSLDGKLASQEALNWLKAHLEERQI